jgi:hypothetical protein
MGLHYAFQAVTGNTLLFRSLQTWKSASLVYIIPAIVQFTLGTDSLRQDPPHKKEKSSNCLCGSFVPLAC